MRYSATVENMEVKSIRIGLLGCGNVGKALVDLLEYIEKRNSFTRMKSDVNYTNKRPSTSDFTFIWLL